MRISKTGQIVEAVLVIVVVCAGLLVLPKTTRGQGAEAKERQRDSFFIISSVDAEKSQIVLKLPSEVTEVVEVSSKTTYRDEKGNSIKFADLRAGDTVYATLRHNDKGVLTVVSIRRGPMTLEELHRRYLLEE